MLSIGGRLTLCKAALDALPVYYFSSFLAPKTVIKDIDKLRRRFLWGSEENRNCINWVGWDRITSDKKSGGLGLKDLHIFNLAFMAKWIWKFHVEPNSLWVKVVKAIHGADGGLESEFRRPVCGSQWRCIIKGSKKCGKYGLEVVGSIMKKVGNGRSTRFWFDRWCVLKQPLCDICPRLFELEANPECVVADRWVRVHSGYSEQWNWRSEPRGRSTDELPIMEMVLRECKLQERFEDRWFWSASKEGRFTIKELYQVMSKAKKGMWPTSDLHCWNNWVPLKINVCIWRARQDRLPTLKNLCDRGIQIAQPQCVLCGCSVESLSHIFFECIKVVQIWKKLYAWWQVPFPNHLNWSSISIHSKIQGFKADEEKAFLGVRYVLMWAIWKWRNEVLHSSEEEKDKGIQKDIFPSIQNFSSSWIRYRSGKLGWDWTSWVLNPRGRLVSP